jgi:hypothetical protein
MNWEKDLRPWAHRDEQPAVLKTLPKPAKDEFDLSDSGQAAYNRFALEQEAIARQKALDEQVDPRLSPDEIKALFEQEQAQQREVDGQRSQYDNARTFVAECPTYIMSDANSRKMVQFMDAAGLDGSSVDHFHRAYAKLAEAGVLRVKEAPAQPREQFTEAELYNLPMDQLEDLVRNPGTVRISPAQGTRATRRKFGVR